MSSAAAASPAGSSALLAAVASSALVAAITLFFSELLRISSTELRERVFTPRITRRLLQRSVQVRRAARGLPVMRVRGYALCRCQLLRASGGAAAVTRKGA
jgi:hypothetical protein